MNIELLMKLDNLKFDLKEIKAKEMKLRKQIMAEISGDYEGEKEKFEWVDEDTGSSAVVTCDLKLSLDQENYLKLIKAIVASETHDLDFREKACIDKKITYSINKHALKNIPEDSVIYELIDSAPVLPTIKYEIGE